MPANTRALLGGGEQRGKGRCSQQQAMFSTCTLLYTAAKLAMHCQLPGVPAASPLPKGVEAGGGVVLLAHRARHGLQRLGGHNGVRQRVQDEGHVLQVGRDVESRAPEAGAHAARVRPVDLALAPRRGRREGAGVVADQF